jgi:hypothetical protein
MRFLPNSFIVGTTKRLLNSGKKSRRSVSPTKKNEQVLAQNWSSFNQDSRSFEQLLELSKKNRENR